MALCPKKVEITHQQLFTGQLREADYAASIKEAECQHDCNIVKRPYNLPLGLGNVILKLNIAPEPQCPNAIVSVPEQSTRPIMVNVASEVIS